MNNFIKTAFVFFVLNAYAAEDDRVQKIKIGTINIIRGSHIFVYNSGEKRMVTDKSLPYTLYSGDEVQTLASSDCEAALESTSSLYLGPETLLYIDKKAAPQEAL